MRKRPALQLRRSIMMAILISLWATRELIMKIKSILIHLQVQETRMAFLLPLPRVQIAPAFAVLVHLGAIRPVWQLQILILTLRMTLLLAISAGKVLFI